VDKKEPNSTASNMTEEDGDDTSHQQDWHTEMLCRMFLSCNEQELQWLEKEVQSAHFKGVQADNTSSTSHHPTYKIPTDTSLIDEQDILAYNIPTDTSLNKEHDTAEIVDETNTKGDTKIGSSCYISCALANETQQQPLDSTMLSLVPNILSTTFDEDSNKVEFEKPLQLPPSWKRSDYASKTLTELEQHIIDLSTGGGSSRENDVLIGNNNSGNITNDTNSSNSKSPIKNYELFPILYNECSLTAFANWAMLDSTIQWDKCKENHERHRAANRSEYKVTIPAPMFHMCGVCGGFGHYEVECESIHENRLQKKKRRVEQTESKDSLLNEREQNIVVSSLSKEVHTQRMQEQSLNAERQILVDKNPTSDDQYKSMACCKICFTSLDDTTMLVCDGCDGLFHCRCLNPPLRSIPTGDWFCDKCASHDDDVNSIVDVEGCGDFVIEQRKRSVAEEANMDGTGINRGLTKDYWTTAISLLPAPIPSVAKTNLYLYKHLGRENGGKDFFIGEVCWAQRSNVWWPAKVKHNKSRRVKGISKQQTIYTLSFFALDEETDVPDTDILPFIPYYEDIGHRRLISEKDTTFHNALVECVSSLGMKSLGQCLQLARDGIQFAADENGGEHRNLLPIGFKIPEDWETADIDVIRDEVFLSKSKSSKNASPRSRKKASAKKKQDSTNDVKTSYKPMVQEFNADDLIGGIVSWKSDLTTASEVRYGLVISLDTTTETVLVRMISLPGSDDELFYKNTSESFIIHTSNLGATMWVSLKSIRFVSSKPSLEDLDEFKKKLQVGIQNETDSYGKQFKEEATIRERFTLELQEIDDH